MKKSLFFIGAMAILMASCSQENENLPIVNNDKAVGFGVYSQSTRGKQATVEDFTSEGIGVFAFYQPATNGIAGPDFTTIKYPTPNFMYNQKVTSSEGKWSYSPLKYWPNNVNDKLSFFAYAPYKENTTWEDLGITTDATGKSIAKTFVIYNDVNDQVDYLYAAPKVNQTKPTNTGDSIKFEFKHALSKVNLFVGVSVDSMNNNSSSGSPLTSTDAPANWNDANTTITIESIEFKDLYQTYTYKWTNGVDATPEGNGKQTIKIVPSDADHANVIKKDTWYETRWHNVFGNVNGLPDSSFMFIAPQELADQEIVITYTVKTVDSENTYNSSEITNVITKTWNDFRNEDLEELKAGTQYKLYFIIGMQSVKLAAKVVDWVPEGSDPHVIDVPTANN